MNYCSCFIKLFIWHRWKLPLDHFPLYLNMIVTFSPLNIKYESQYQGQKEKGKVLTTKWTSTFSLFLSVSLSVVFLVWKDSGWSWMMILLYIKSSDGKRASLSSPHFRICRPPTICQAAWPLTLSRVCQGECCHGRQLPASETDVSWYPPWCFGDLCWGFLKWSRGGDLFRGFACWGWSFAWALFPTAGAVGRHRGS